MAYLQDLEQKMPNFIILPTLLEGYYSSGKRQPRGTISHFLCGIQDGDIFRSFCRVGSGVSQKDLYDLGILIHIHWTKSRTSEEMDGTLPIIASFENT